MQLSAKLLILSIGLIGLVVVGRAPTAVADDKIKGGFVSIKLIDAKVPDMDPLPLQRESDVFAKIYQMLKVSEENKQKGQQDKELICETQTIQDDNSPKVSFEAWCKVRLKLALSMIYDLWLVLCGVVLCCAFSLTLWSDLVGAIKCTIGDCCFVFGARIRRLQSTLGSV